MALNRSLSINNYGNQKFIVSSNAALGNYSTLASAMADAVSGDTIFLRDSVTENITITPGVNIASFEGAEQTPTVSITGTITMSGAGTSTISGIRLTTNSANIIVVSGSAASILTLENCYLNCSNNTGISFTASNSSATINIYQCYGNLGTTGIALFAHSSTGVLNIMYSQFSNTGGSTTASTISSGSLNTQYSIIRNPITTSGTAICGIGNGTDMETGSQNVTCFTSGGSGAHSATQSTFSSGTASAISISNTLLASLLTVVSSNTNAVTGAGTLNNCGISFAGSSSKINTSTQTAFNFDVGGISFDGGTNILSNYTEGTFTPTLVGQTTAGTTTYTAQNGYYRRIGTQVTIQFVVQSSASTGTGNLLFGAFPYTIKNQTNGNTFGTGIIPNSGVTWVASTTSIAIQGNINSTGANIYLSGSGTNGGNLQIQNTSYNMQFSLSYEV